MPGTTFQSRLSRSRLPSVVAVDPSTARQLFSQTRPAPSPPTTPPPPAEDTHYALFPSTFPHGPPPASPFAVDVRALRREFLALQARAHPDKVAAAAGRGEEGGAAARAAAERASAQLNGAFRVLADPLLRAQYLLALRGVDVADDAADAVQAWAGGDGGGDTGEQQRLQMERMMLLEQVMEVREQIEEAQSEAQVDALRHENEGRIAEAEGALGTAFAGLGEGEGQGREYQETLKEATRWAIRLRYWVNVRDTLHNWEKGQAVVLQH